MRTFSRLDRIIDQLDQGLKSVLVPPPADPYPETVPREQDGLSPEERVLGGRLMRVNHAGEIAAQALYQGHALCARDAHAYDTLRTAGRDELQHLHWTAARIKELKTHKSYLTPVWYLGSFAIGATTALLGDKVSLGFVAETERQVIAHLQGHLAKLPATDQKTRAIIEHMAADEARHAASAMEAGGQPLPWPARLAMRLAARVMTKTAFWI
ncbi:demethoxyubiquinone hydroxylase family protein [Acidiferrobacter sp. SPIII_3]|uniref:2-polyprenyl-3-methyl-6-methoxy-1,4-benzoquinone monooxygenase n=1 Tax=Acidiferrobacter sp. SPIII_3 TaxID=1281578 RepID=UPI000D72B5E2|nr:2-polyprenyl-3-methyl-6-methoxy-1,4-benzoquinone monooxygenase [Acidiferrobacter sp. SPIII_3]AWP24358.1 demethoxyubiquinone hydroxylase family protein [Acidiferrobacter sp. SPIII_3]